MTSFTPRLGDGNPRDVGDRLSEIYSIMDFIPVAKQADILDYTSTDDVSTYVQAAIAAVTAAGGGRIVHPPGLFNVSGVTLASGVGLFGAGEGGTFGYSPVAKTIYKATAAGWMVEMTDSASNAHRYTAGVCGIAFAGLGSGTAAKGVRIGINNYWCFVRNCQFDNLSGQAFVLDGIGGVAEDILVTNCLKSTPGAKTGAGEIAGSDNYASRIECSADRGTVTNATNLYLCALAVTGANNFIHQCVGEEADVGIRVTGFFNKFTACRADLNWGHGWEIDGAANFFGQCHALSNGQATDNTYDNWVVLQGGSGFDGCDSSYLTSNKPRYSLRDTVNSDSAKNFYGPACRWGTGYGTATFNMNNFAGSAVHVPKGPTKTWADGDATPSVVAYGHWITANTSDTTITDFDDGVPGQMFWLLVNDAHTLVVNGGAIFTAERKNKRLVSGQWYCFVHNSNFWYEVALSQALRATATYDPPSLAAGAKTSIQTLTVTGASLGDRVAATFSNDLAGAQLRAWVSAANTVSYYFVNENGANPLNLASGTVAVQVSVI